MNPLDAALTEMMGDQSPPRMVSLAIARAGEPDLVAVDETTINVSEKSPREKRILNARAFHASGNLFSDMCSRGRREKLTDDEMEWLSSLPRRKRRAFLAEMRRA